MSFTNPHTRRTVLFSAAAIVLLGVLLLIPLKTSPRSLGAREAYALLRSDSTIVVLDVRTAEEFRGSTGRLEHALLIPVESLGNRLEELASYKGRTLLVYCRSGRRSRNAAALLERQGFNAINLDGGILEWNSCGFPVIHEKERS